MPTRHLLVIHLHTEKSSQSATCSSESHWKRKHSQSVSPTTGICNRADPSNTIACTGAKSLHLTPCIVKSDSGVRAPTCAGAAGQRSGPLPGAVPGRQQCSRLAAARCALLPRRPPGPSARLTLPQTLVLLMPGPLRVAVAPGASCQPEHGFIQTIPNHYPIESVDPSKGRLSHVRFFQHTKVSVMRPAAVCRYSNSETWKS